MLKKIFIILFIFVFIAILFYLAFLRVNRIKTCKNACYEKMKNYPCESIPGGCPIETCYSACERGGQYYDVEDKCFKNKDRHECFAY